MNTKKAQITLNKILKQHLDMRKRIFSKFYSRKHYFKKVPVTAPYGHLISDSVIAPHDYTDCGGAQPNTLQCRVTDVYGNTIRLHGAPHII